MLKGNFGIRSLHRIEILQVETRFVTKAVDENRMLVDQRGEMRRPKPLAEQSCLTKVAPESPVRGFLETEERRRPGEHSR
jgi:hypothetical protein